MGISVYVIYGFYIEAKRKSASNRFNRSNKWESQNGVCMHIDSDNGTARVTDVIILAAAATAQYRQVFPFDRIDLIRCVACCGFRKMHRIQSAFFFSIVYLFFLLIFVCCCSSCEIVWFLSLFTGAIRLEYDIYIWMYACICVDSNKTGVCVCSMLLLACLKKQPFKWLYAIISKNISFALSLSLTLCVALFFPVCLVAFFIFFFFLSLF